MPARPLLRRTLSDESNPGPFGVLPKRTRDSSPSVHASSFNELSPCPTLPQRPQLSRGTSSPILSNGKPLKSSLKSSTSPPQARRTHHRSCSEPPTTKRVHFPEEDDALATIRVYDRSAHPAALSNLANDNGNLTETEGELAPSARFPFPSLSSVLDYEIDPTKSFPVPSNPSPSADLLLESLNLSSSSSTSTTTKHVLTGSILVCNLAFEKHVAVRFTLDDWETVSEVGAHYVESLSLPPSQILFPQSPPTMSDTIHQRGRGWDRFAFTIHLEGDTRSWSTRTLWLAARYCIGSTYPEPGSSQYGPGGEWWDNNGGRNYRIGFRPAITVPRSPGSIPHPETVSVPISSPSITRLNEHALDVMVLSVFNDKEERHLTLRHTRKFNLCNYVPPAICSPSVSYTSVCSPQTSSPPWANKLLPPSAALRSSADEETTSPASSTLSTPCGSPTIAPRVIIGPLATGSIYGSSEDDNAITSSRPGHIEAWDWSAPTEPTLEGLSCPHVDLVSGSESPERYRGIPSPPRTKTSHDSNSLYATFVSNWCFAQGPSPDHHAYGGGGMSSL
ncbi:carbohydrate-binding module family 21 protein [Boletus edulis]|nr:carbohydrate-binding module family 21 protein [Boletus edulis]